MADKATVSSQTRRNWIIDAGLLISAVLVALSGIYFLYLPVNGFQGGRNPFYGVVILFGRETWDLVHTWTGVAMIAIATLHLVLHWHWVTNMLGRMVKEWTGERRLLNARGRFNLYLNLVVGISFLLVAVSGLYFLFVTGGHSAPDPGFLFSRTVWDLLHTWSGVTLVAAAVLHFMIHWKWVTKVTTRVLVRARIPSTLVSARTTTVGEAS